MATQPISNLVTTWNAAGTTFNAIKMNVTDTASAAGSLLMDLQVGGSSRFQVSAKTSETFIAKFSSSGIERMRVGTQASGTNLELFAASPNTYIGMGTIGSPDVRLYRDDPNIFAQRNGTNAQTFRVYKTFTDTSNYLRVALDTTGQPSLMIQSAGTGGATNFEINNQTAGAVAIATNGTSRWQINSSGHFIAATDNAYDIGASGATRPRIIYAGAGFEAAGTGTVGFSDVWFSRDAANTLAQRNGVNAQLFRIYNTYTDASNYERLTFTWSGGGDARIQTEKGGTGTVRSLIFGTDGSARWLVASTTGHFLAGTDSTYDIGAVGANRPRDIFSARDVYANSNTGGFYWGLSGDLALFRDDANILAQRRSTNAQTFRVYNTYTDASNYERASVGWSASTFRIATEALGTGSPRQITLATSSSVAPIQFITNNTDRWNIAGAGHFLANTDNAYDIGASGANRPRAIYTAGLADIRGSLYVGGAVEFIGVSAGVVTLREFATSAFNRLQFGGTSSAFPALKRIGAGIDVRLADDSAFGSLQAANLTANGNLVVSSAGLIRFGGGGGRSDISSPADGILLVTDNAGTSFNRLQFGGTTSAFPSLKRNGASLQLRLADDSSSADFTAAQITANASTAMPAGGAVTAGVKMSTTANFGVFFGSGAPTLSAAKGSLYLRSDGTTTNDRMYVNTDGATTWTAVTTAA